ncbi:hypothetical protein F4861DRAFT_373634 [Xylaria intraflava]|nr:hypothetical protein F4861DRAFT_373634 [Xylaria intraflava]
MRILQCIAAAAAVFSSAVADVKVVGPFALRVTGKKDTTVNGYAWACHAGAATEGLCYTAGSSPVSGAQYEFYYNYTFYESDSYPGFISYVVTYQGDSGEPVHVPSFMRIIPVWSSNVHLALITPDVESGTPVSLDFDAGLFFMRSLYDDSHWNATAPSGQSGIDVANFQLCYQWTGGYWYQSIAWLSGLPSASAQNPSCQSINLGVESLAGS